MRKHVIALATVALLGWSIQSMAADLETDMDTIADNYGKILKTDSKADFLSGLEKMKAAAQDAKKSKPPKFDSKPDNSPEIQDYHKGLDTLIGQIDKASELAKADKMADAKKEAEGFKETRNENHKKFR
ncbi:cytochrome B562 [Rouxiella silvae]|uniref:Cytochrome b562 n=1 Tax=Rouxiella silvae TaxID=1646373 RepID=A0AA40X6T2_9GAMM|nr:cytochrome b562 [Rouxiella silvae]KQN49216.1 cytochrome B562 [Serratia sp. Leaf50]MBF6639409.1 cytochrome b562 [Rouxiella silvae]ORJ21103.1 cytochrome B562 [Rouxiella silvae]